MNLIQLDPKNEHLRDSLFYHIFKRTLLFDDMDTALAYRRSQISQDKQPPKIYTLAGKKVGTDGILDPGAERRQDSRNLKFVFGMQPPTKSSVYINLLTGKGGADQLENGRKEGRKEGQELL